jgi:hypothetical protein
MKKQCGGRSVLLALLLFVAAGQNVAGAASEITAKGNVSQGDNIPLLDQGQEKKIDEVQGQASVMLLESARWVDAFFDDGRAVAEENQTRATLKLALGYSKNDAFEIQPRLDLRLKLPGVSNRVNLLIAAAEDEDFNADNDPLTNTSLHQDSEKSEFTAALQYYLKETKKYNISFDTGASWQYLFAGLRYRASQDFGEWHGRFTNRLRYYTDDGLENRTFYDLENQLSGNWLFRATTSVNLLEGEKGVPHAQQFRLYQVLSPFQAISYESGVYFDTEPSHKLTDTQLVVRYRQRFYRDWLVLEISPRVTFPEDHDREVNPGIVVNLQADFGYNADEEGYRKIFH